MEGKWLKKSFWMIAIEDCTFAFFECSSFIARITPLKTIYSTFPTTSSSVSVCGGFFLTTYHQHSSFQTLKTAIFFKCYFYRTQIQKKYLRDLKFNWKLNYYMYEIIGEKVCLLTTQWIWTIANHNTQLVWLDRVAITWNWNAQPSTHIMQSVRLISIYCWTLEIDFEMNTHESCIIIFIVIGNNLRVHNVNHKQLVNRHNNGIIRHLKHTTQHKRKTTLMLRVFASFK